MGKRTHHQVAEDKARSIMATCAIELYKMEEEDG